jgi:hypothetical protein
MEVVDQQVPHRCAFDPVAIDEFFDAELTPSGRREDRVRGISAEQAGLEEKPIPVRAFLNRVADLGPVGLDTVSDGDVGECAAVVDQHAGELLKHRLAVGRNEPVGGGCDPFDLGEPVDVVAGLEPVEGAFRGEPVEPAVARADHTQHDELPGGAQQLASTGGPAVQPGVFDEFGPAAPMRVQTADQPPLLPGVAVEPLQPIEQDHDSVVPCPRVAGAPRSRLFGEIDVAAVEHHETVGRRVGPTRRAFQQRHVRRRGTKPVLQRPSRRRQRHTALTPEALARSRHRVDVHIDPR